MGNNDAAVQVRTSVVLIRGELDDNSVIEQELPLQHAVGTPEQAIIGNALGILRQMGGLVVNNANTVDFYPLRVFKKVNFSVKAIVLAIGNSLTH